MHIRAVSELECKQLLSDKAPCLPSAPGCLCRNSGVVHSYSINLDIHTRDTTVVMKTGIRSYLRIHKTEF